METYMNMENTTVNEDTKRFVESKKADLIRLKERMDAKRITFADDNQNNVLTLDGRQRILSIELDDVFIESSDKREISNRLMQMINRSIQKAGSAFMAELKEIIDPIESDNIFSEEPKEVKTSVEALKREIPCYFKEMLAYRKEAVSNRGIVRIIVNGAKLLSALDIDPEFLNKKEKILVIEEIIETVNEANAGIQADISKRFIKMERDQYANRLAE
jgi:DNA-binding protein YbaB